MPTTPCSVKSPPPSVTAGQVVRVAILRASGYGDRTIAKRLGLRQGQVAAIPKEVAS